MKKINTSGTRVGKITMLFVFFLFIILFVRMFYLCLVDQKVGDTTLSVFTSNRNTIEEDIYPLRGSIYDNNGNVLAQTVASYTVIAYLSPTRSENSDKILHVSDVSMTASALAPYLDMDYDDLVYLLSKDAYQVELGPGGRNLSTLEMEKIAALNLPGIDFVKSTKRYYANGDFASYILGYTVTDKDDENNLVGEMGIEEYYNDTLTGEKGYVTYERDRYGYKIANGREFTKSAKNGSDIYLTIDNNIQLFLENAVKDASTNSNAKWTLMAVMDAKTGAILGYSSNPSFDPNVKNITSYLDPLTGNAYEPGSTMKIFSYLCAIDKGTYNGEATYTSGSISFESEVDDDVVTISDWNKTGWGDITYDAGFALSSNIAVANILKNYITKNELKECYEKYGFGTKTGFTYKRELAGSIEFKYDIEAATAGYGQGITITPIQMLQALTAISNNGEMLKPYIVSKIVSSSGTTLYEGERTVVGTIAKRESTDKIKELMKSVVNPDSSIATGSSYYLDGYDLIGKTGTAQIYDYSSGSYKKGSTENIYSFAGMFPYDDPEIIIYMAMEEPKDASTYLSTAVKEVMVNISKYLNLDDTSSLVSNYTVKSFLNKSISSTINELNNFDVNYVVLGDGDVVINQYPLKNQVISSNNTLFLLTNNFKYKMINLYGLSYSEVVNVLELMGIGYEISGSGYVKYQSISEGTSFNEGDVISITLGK